ncbi:Dbl homology domain-containing protein [Mucor mucedo]|uniref:Dbl homology domain-containing protein n=1 Tax=Mucor mucedo TaxID=29922 RepID=UPI00221EBA25|nr:Dbl homology domain-containing protein [Mucor mucedo]KAI7893499.1 Dbl homology domain-containing protein [Mucor mucedo]
MNSNNILHDEPIHSCCCCCCYCCCYKSANQITSPNMESICSCSGSISSNSEEKEEEEEEVSTGNTTPIDPKSSQEPVEKLLRKKVHAMEELLQTERDYVHDLTHLVQVCLEVLFRQQWISSKHKSIIARNSFDILQFHKHFIVSFDAALAENWSCVAKTFIDQMSSFSLYKHYCDMHAEAWALTTEYRDRPEWNHFLRECALINSFSIPLNLNLLNDSIMQQQQQKKLHFQDYLIKPVQRICRYQLLIKEILRYTPPQSTEYDLWNIALDRIQGIVTEIDHCKFIRDRKERTDKFIARLDGGDWRISKKYVAQLDSLLMAGGIEVTYSALGQSVSKPRYLGCFLFRSYIIMVRPKKITSYEPKHWFPLKMTDFEDLNDIEGQREHAFVLRCKKHTFAFSASCWQEKQLWVKQIGEAIAATKSEVVMPNLSAQDFIVSSLPGITGKRSPQSIRLSRSFTNILDLASGDAKANNLRRSVSTNLQFQELIQSATRQEVSLKKRYSADYSSCTKKQALKPRNNSEMYIKPDLFPSSSGGLARKRPSSLDLLSAANNTGNMIGKMSLQFKSNHQNALRLTVDHKLRDVCTQEYLESRAWQMRDNTTSSSLSYYTSTSTSPTVEFTTNQDGLSKRKSTSFIRSSASSFSLIPKRTDKYDIQSNTSSCSSSLDRTQRVISRRPSQSSQLLRKMSQSRGISESPVTEQPQQKKLEKSASRRQLFVGKVLRRISSLHHKPSAPASSSFEQVSG